MKTARISKQSVKNANRVLVERSRSQSVPIRYSTIKLSASEINSAYRKVLNNGKKV